MARSSRMCGKAGVSSASGLELQAWRAKARETARRAGDASGLQGGWILGQIAGENGGLGGPVEDLAAQPLAGQRNADDARQALPARSGFCFPRRSQGGKRHHLDLRARKLGARDGLLRQKAQDGLQPVVAGVVQVVGLGGSKQQAVDAAGENARQPCMRAGPEALEHGLERVLQVGDGCRRPN